MNSTTFSSDSDPVAASQPPTPSGRWELPQWQRWPVELVRLFQAYGPGWMLAVVFLCTLPALLFSGGFLLQCAAAFMKAFA